MSPDDADEGAGARQTPEVILARLGAGEGDLDRACRTLGLARLEVTEFVPELAVGPDDALGAPDVRVFVTFADEPDIVEVMDRLRAVENLLDSVFNRRVAATSFEILERAIDRNTRDRYLAGFVTVFDAKTEEPVLAGREAEPPEAQPIAKPAKRIVERRFSVRTRTDEDDCLVVEISYGKRASAVVAEAARLRRENTRDRWRGLAAADLDDDEGLLRRYGKLVGPLRRPKEPSRNRED